MANLLLDQGVAALQFSRKMLLSLLEDFPEDKWTYQPIEGTNHALWNLGHVASTDDYFLRTLGQRASMIPDDWNGLFGMGSTPQPNVTDYPAASALMDALHRNRETLLAWFQSMSAEQLATPLPEEWKGFAPNHAILMATIACHEGMHAGQLTVIRKALKMGPKFG